MTREEFERYIETVAEGLATRAVAMVREERAARETALAIHERTIERLRSELTEVRSLAQRSAPSLADQHRGVWNGRVGYRRDELVTWKGALHVALCDSEGTEPGQGVAWRELMNTRKGG